jgi:hypothetical protein
VRNIRVFVLAVSLLAASRAHANERATTLTIGGTSALGEPGGQTEAVLGRATLAWEHAPLDLPARRGYAFASALVPELFVGGLLSDDRAEGFVGAGLRAELKMAQRDMGLLRVSARAAAYVAARALVIGERRAPAFELAFGEYLLRRHGFGRIGLEIGVLFRDGRGDTVHVTGAVAHSTDGSPIPPRIEPDDGRQVLVLFTLYGGGGL